MVGINRFCGNLQTLCLALRLGKKDFSIIKALTHGISQSQLGRQSDHFLRQLVRDRDMSLTCQKHMETYASQLIIQQLWLFNKTVVKF